MNFAHLLDTGTYSDFKFDVSGRQFKAHRCIMATASPVLDKWFKNNPTISAAKFNSDPKVFQYFLAFIYKQELPHAAEMAIICVQLYQLADRYKVDNLKFHCKIYLEMITITADNALNLYECATTYRFENLVKRSWSFIKR